MQEIQLGQKVRDKSTGFSGVAEHRTTHIYDAVKFGVQAPMGSDGKYGECYSIDHISLEIIDPLPVLEAMPSTPKYKLGSKAKCKITGFEGTIVYYTQYINGCVYYGIQPAIPNNCKAGDYTAQKFPEGALEIIEDPDDKITKTANTKTGGPKERIIKTF